MTQTPGVPPKEAISDRTLLKVILGAVGVVAVAIALTCGLFGASVLNRLPS